MVEADKTQGSSSNKEDPQKDGNESVKSEKHDNPDKSLKPTAPSKENAQKQDKLSEEPTASLKDAKTAIAEPHPHVTSAYSAQHSFLKNRNKRNIPFMIAYHLVFWSILAGATAPFFYKLANIPKGDRFPMYFGKGSFISGKPKMSIYPRNIVKGKVEYPLHIHVVANNTDLPEQLHEQLKTHFNHSQTTNLIDCKRNVYVSSDWNDKCEVDGTDDDPNYGFGACAFDSGGLSKYGYDISTPCVMVKFNKVLGFSPSLNNLTQVQSTAGLCTDSTSCCHNYRVPVNCTSTAPGQVQFEIFPSKGISMCMWPYIGQQGYVNPMFMMKISSIPAEGVTFTCFADVDGMRPKNPQSLDAKDDSHVLVFKVSV